MASLSPRRLGIIQEVGHAQFADVVEPGGACAGDDQVGGAVGGFFEVENILLK